MNYITASNPDFDAFSVEAEEALFLFRFTNGEQAMGEVHLFDGDEESPSGYCWDFTLYVWDIDRWCDWDGGRYWDFADADSLYPEFFSCFPSVLTLEDSVQVDHDLFDVLHDEPRQFMPYEFEAGKPMD